MVRIPKRWAEVQGWGRPRRSVRSSSTGARLLGQVDASPHLAQLRKMALGPSPAGHEECCPFNGLAGRGLGAGEPFRPCAVSGVSAQRGWQGRALAGGLSREFPRLSRACNHFPELGRRATEERRWPNPRGNRGLPVLPRSRRFRLGALRCSHRALSSFDFPGLGCQAVRIKTPPHGFVARRGGVEKNSGWLQLDQDRARCVVSMPNKR